MVRPPTPPPKLAASDEKKNEKHNNTPLSASNKKRKPGWKGYALIPVDEPGEKNDENVIIPKKRQRKPRKDDEFTYDE